jgi:drug/metabolite transporter (DMT)-like permease
MTALAHDEVAPVAAGSRLVSGLGFAVLSAASFGMSGALARPLLDAGWSAGAVVLVRVGLAALVVLPFGLVALRGRWALLRRNAGVMAVYGTLAVAGAQFCWSGRPCSSSTPRPPRSWCCSGCGTGNGPAE